MVDAAGFVVLDSTGAAEGQDFANGERPEIDAALGVRPSARERFSDTIEGQLLVAAAPIVEDVPSGRCGSLGTTPRSRRPRGAPGSGSASWAAPPWSRAS